jgi:hypothetical protein
MFAIAWHSVEGSTRGPVQKHISDQERMKPDLIYATVSI